MYSNVQANNFSWSGWTFLGNNGVGFSGSPAAAQIDKYNGNSTGYFALAEVSNQAFHVRISTRNDCCIQQNWTAVPGGLFVSSPAIAVSTSTAAFGPKSTLLLAGLRTDGQIYFAQNALVNGTYVHGNWTAFTAIPGVGFATAPAVTWACPRSASQPAFMAAAISTDQRLYVNSLVGSSWSGWQALSTANLFPTSAPAIATSCTATGKRTMVFVRGADSRIYYTADRGDGVFAPSFTSMWGDTFADGPGATGLVIPGASNLWFYAAARMTTGELKSILGDFSP